MTSPRTHKTANPQRRKAQLSALLLSLVRRARFLWLGWLEAKWAALRQWRARRAVLHAAAPDRPMIETLEPKLLLSAELMPMDSTNLMGPPAELRLIDAATDVQHQSQVTDARPLSVGAAAVATANTPRPP